MSPPWLAGTHRFPVPWNLGTREPRKRIAGPQGRRGAISKSRVPEPRNRSFDALDHRQRRSAPRRERAPAHGKRGRARMGTRLPPTPRSHVAATSTASRRGAVQRPLGGCTSRPAAQLGWLRALANLFHRGAAAASLPSWCSRFDGVSRGFVVLPSRNTAARATFRGAVVGARRSSVPSSAARRGSTPRGSTHEGCT